MAILANWPFRPYSARLYDIYTLDQNIEFTRALLNMTDPSSSNSTLLPDRSEDVYVTSASVNLRDQVRRGEHVPLQFAYEAADCRIWYTPQTIFNYTALWQYAADAIWTNASLRATGSTGFATSPANNSDFIGAPASAPPPPQ
jgi:hypothetical protein